jgi:predicted Zn-dependent peptidase
LIRREELMEIYTHTLDNGIRLIHQSVNSPVAHCGILVNTGSRDELENQHGMAHFIEHIIFKGTQKRRAHHILSRMEDVGGEINAYTTKEETCVHTSFFNNYYSRAFELISDLVFDSVFPEKEINREREVILDEINSYKDSPYEEINDDFEEQIFTNNPLARNILGNEEALKSYSRSMLLEFFTGNFPTNEMVVSSVSSVPFNKILACFKKYFADIPLKTRQIPRILYDPLNYTQRTEKKERNSYQTHCIIGNQAYSVFEEKRLALHLLNNLLGGPGMNSRLNMTLRERRGLAYNIESNYSTYSDAGIISIYFGTDKKNLNKCIDLTMRELKSLRDNSLGIVQLHRAKRQLIGQIAIGSEINENQMFSIGRSLLLFNKIDSLEDITKKIEEITSEEILEVANEILDENKLSHLIYH